MKIKNNVKVCDISWNKSGIGIIKNFYLPENIEELINLVNKLNSEQKKFDIIGHTSNILFKNTYNPEYLISTRLLTKFEISNNILICECGAHAKRVSQFMLEEGYEGVEGLIDLPGTIGAAIYGNAGCYNCSFSDLLLYVDILQEDGTITRYDKVSLHFANRTSDIKRGKINGVIIRSYFELKRGNKEILLSKAEEYRKHRKATQPNSNLNLGSIFSYTGKMRFSVKILTAILCIPFIISNLKRPERVYINKMIFSFYGRKDLLKYIDKGRWIWKDEKSYKKFDEYVTFYKFIYPNSKLEIKIFE